MIFLEILLLNVYCHNYYSKATLLLKPMEDLGKMTTILDIFYYFHVVFLDNWSTK